MNSDTQPAALAQNVLHKRSLAHNSVVTAQNVLQNQLHHNRKGILCILTSLLQNIIALAYNTLSIEYQLTMNFLFIISLIK